MPSPLAPHNIRTHWYGALVCAGAVALCVLVAHPVVEMGMIDDWSYVYSARHLAATGHVTYNGWAAPMQAWEMALSALFIKVLGFSFTVARIPVLLVAMLTAVVFERSLVWMGVSEWNATIGTLSLVLSPLCLALSFTLMTDIPALFCLVLCLYCCLRALRAETDRAALWWLAIAAIGNMVSGTVRQTAWLGALVMVPSVAWLMRRRRGVPAVAATLWLAGVAVVLGSLSWYSRQPNSLTEHLMDRRLAAGELLPLSVLLLHSVLAVIFYLSPVLAGFAVGFPFRRWRWLTLLAVGNVVLLAPLFVGLRHRWDLGTWVAPFFWNIVNNLGLMNVGELQGIPPIVFAFKPRLLVTGVVALIFLCFLLPAVAPKLQPRRAVTDALGWGTLLILLGPTCAVYLLLLLPRAALHGLMLDRYMLPVIAFLLSPLLLHYQERVADRLPILSVVAVLLMAALGVAGMHDVFAFDRARLTAINEIRASGVPRTEIRGAWDYDGWTEIEARGVVNGTLVTELSRPSRGAAAPRPSKQQCSYWFSVYTPSIVPRYALAYQPDECLGPAPFAPVWAGMWLQPKGETVYVVRAR